MICPKIGILGFCFPPLSQTYCKHLRMTLGKGEKYFYAASTGLTLNPSNFEPKTRQTNKHVRETFQWAPASTTFMHAYSRTPTKSFKSIKCLVSQEVVGDSYLLQNRNARLWDPKIWHLTPKFVVAKSTKAQRSKEEKRVQMDVTLAKHGSKHKLLYPSTDKSTNEESE